jgi:hypothetical protein
MKRRAGLLAVLALASAAAPSQEFTFDAAQYQRKPYELTGYVELKAERFDLDRGSAFYGLNFVDRADRDSIGRYTLLFKPSAKLRLGEATTAYARAHLESQRDSLSGSRSNRFDEAYLSYKPDPGLTLDAGKLAQRWGKAYAWNPVGFIERPKDPNDPELAREGFTLLSADLIRNFAGPLQTLAFTPVLLPVSSNTNSDFGAPGHMNIAAKLYLLYRDTDIDVMFLNGGSRPRRYGFDFSRNLASNLEVHGEWARVHAVQAPLVDAGGTIRSKSFDATSYVLGARYLTERDTTWIVEYYRNGAGYSEAELGDFFALLDNGLARFRATGDPSVIRRASTLAQGPYGRPNAGQRYLYLRASQKEPFDILYFTPSLTVIANLDDRSGSVAPELLYTGITNVELRARAFFLAGGHRTEFGERQNSRRLELLARFFF